MMKPGGLCLFLFSLSLVQGCRTSLNNQQDLGGAAPVWRETIYQRSDGTRPDIAAIWGDSDCSTMVAVGYLGLILTSRDRGASWIETASPHPSGPELGVWGASANDVYVVGEGVDGQLHSNDGGLHWASVQFSSPSDYRDTLARRAVWGTNEGLVLSVGEGWIARIENDQWSFLDVPSELQLNPSHGVWGISQDDVWVCGNSGLISHGTQGAGDWSSQKIGDTDFYGIRGYQVETLYVVGDRGTILRSADAGGTWLPEDSTTAASLRSIWGTKDGINLFVVGTAGTILHSDDSGEHWSSEPSGISEDLLGVWGCGTTVYAVGAAGTILRRGIP